MTNFTELPSVCRVLRVCGKGTKTVLIPLPPAVGRAIDRATGSRTHGPILLNSRGTRMDPVTRRPAAVMPNSGAASIYSYASLHGVAAVTFINSGGYLLLKLKTLILGA